MYSPPQLCQPASSLAGRLSGFYFSRGYSSQIAEEVWFSHKEKKKGSVLLRRQALACPLVGGAGEVDCDLQESSGFSKGRENHME